jgi:phosphoribosylformimino-5-aminoimidazole carboxamide ribotide isomerase
MTIYPAIDIKGGRCVRLTQGRADQETVYAENPADVATEFKAAGSTWVHVVDLDGAFTGEPQNLGVVQAIAKVGLRVQLGGGLRTRAAVERALGFGVSRVVIGTRAAESEEFVGELVQRFGGKIAVGIDAKNGQVAVKGWVATAALSAFTSVMSTARVSHVPPRALISAATLLSSSRDRAMARMSKSAAKRSAVARPIPRDAPVITATGLGMRAI